MKTISTTTTAKGRLLYTLFSEYTDGTEHFGVTVSSKLFGDEEVVSVRDITTDPDFAEKITNMLADNLVLPSTLTEVIEECIAAEFTV